MFLLQILGVVFLCLVSLGILLLLLMKRKFGNYISNISKGDSSTPLKIHLIEDIEPEWLNHKKVRKNRSQLKDFGFVEGLAYTVEEMPMLVLQHFYNDKINAILYKHDTVGSWGEFVFDDINGNEYTFSNVADFASKMDNRPENVKYSDSNASITELFEKVKEITRNINPIGFKPDEFRHKCENTYKKDMTFRIRNGGTSYEEFLRVTSVTEGSKKLSEDALKERFIELKLTELNDWHYLALEELSESQGDNYEDDLNYACFIIPEKAHVPTLLEYLKEQDYISEKQLEKLKKSLEKYRNATAYQIIDKINSLFSAERQAKLVCTQDFPLKMRIYRQNYG